MENKVNEKVIANVPEKEEQQEFQFPECCFAATCGSCYYNDGGWCRKYGGWVDADKWACSSYA